MDSGTSDIDFMVLVRAIVAGDDDTASGLLAATPQLAARRAGDNVFFPEITHYVYGGDTARHMAAAGYRSGMVRRLVAMGADVGGRNRRGAQPLHYASDGAPGTRAWNPRAQA